MGLQDYILLGLVHWYVDKGLTTIYSVYFLQVSTAVLSITAKAKKKEKEKEKKEEEKMEVVGITWWSYGLIYLSLSWY